MTLGLLLAACGSEEPNASTTTSGAGGAGGAGTGGSGASTTGAGGDMTDPRFDPLIAAVESEMQELGAPGVAVAVIEDGKVTFARGFGSKDPNADVPVLPTTLFRVGSVNKMLTTAGLLGQVGKGKVDLDAKVTDYVPNFKFKLDDAWAPSIHVRHLLTHTSGMYDYLKVDVPASQQTDAALETFMTGSFGNLDYLMAPPGAFFNYSNPGFYLAGLIAEKTAGKPYRQLMREDVFAPLGMDRTFFLASEVLADGDYALGKADYPEIPETVAPDTYENAWARPAGYAFSSVLDLSKFVAFLLDGDSSVMPAELLAEMQSEQVDTQDFLDIIHYGYGLDVMRGAFLGGPNAFYTMKIVQHGGDIPGFAADVTFVPSLRFGFVTLANADGAHFTHSLVTALTTLAPLPAPSTPPDLTVDPSSFSAYEGVYQDDFNVGEITVTKVGDELHVDMPAVDAANIPYDHVLEPSVGNNFYLSIQGATLPVTFIADETGTSRYFRTRIFVGVRPEMLPPPAPPSLSGDRRARFVDAIRRARPTVIDRLARPHAR